MASSTGGMLGGLNAEPSSGTQVLYGTNINSNDVQLKLRNFLTTFVVMDEDDEKYDQMPYYVEQLKQINETEQFIMDINCDHIYEYDQALYRQLENYPTDIIPIFDLVVTGLYKEAYISNHEGNEDG